jgi:hypothetical protein
MRVSVSAFVCKCVYRYLCVGGRKRDELRVGLCMRLSHEDIKILFEIFVYENICFLFKQIYYTRFYILYKKFTIKFKTRLYINLFY